MVNLTDEQWGWVRLSEVDGVGDATFDLLLEEFGSIGAALSASPQKLIDIGLKPEIANLIKSTLLDKPRYQKLFSSGIVPIFLGDDHYPQKLQKISHPPHILWCYGKLELISSYPQICVVGTRHITKYGSLQTTRFVQYFCSCGATIVSGLAIGVDAIAHLSALSSYGNTIGVVGCGLDIALKTRNDEAFQNVRKEGLLISSFPPFLHPSRTTFPQRNRLMAGMSDAVLIVEAGEKSGALITANYAHKFHIPLYAVPGDMDKWRSKGCNRLIKDGIAKLALNPSETFTDMLFHGPAKKEKEKKLVVDIPLERKEKKIVQIVGKESIDLEEISQRTGIDAGELLNILGKLEINGVIVNNSGVYSLIK